MNRVAQAIGVAMASYVFGGTVAAQAPAQTTLCTLLPKAEAKVLLGASDAFDKVEPRAEESKTGLSCRYADLLVMVHDGPFTPPPNAESIQDLGKEAFFVSSATGVELFADLGTYAGYSKLVISRRLEAGGTTAAGRSGVIAVAKALIAKIKTQ